MNLFTFRVGSGKLVAVAGINNIISRFGSQQLGLVGHKQLKDAGASDKQISYRLEIGHLVSALRGVYRVVGSPVGFRQDLMAAVLFAGTGSAVSHRAAALSHGLLRGPEVVEICTPRRRRARDLPEDWVIHTSIILPRADLISVRGIPTTTVERTLIDLGAVQSRQRVTYAVESALKNGATDLPLLTYVHSRRRGRGRRGAGVLATVLESIGQTGVTESPYERRLLELVIDADLPMPQPQFEIRRGGRFVGRVDFAWPDERLLVEVDGHEYHATREQRAADSQRQNILTEMGFRVVRFTSDQIVESRPEVLRTLRTALRSCDG